MIVPPALHKLARAFHQDLLLDNRTLDEISDYSLGFLSKSEKVELGIFLGRLLDRGAGSTEIKAVWNALPADVIINDAAGIRALFECIRSRLTAQSVRRPNP